MPTTMTVSELIKGLRDQGFEVSRTTEGWHVRAPDGKGTSEIHESTVQKSNGRAYANQIAQLKRIGFKLPEVVKRETTLAKRQRGGPPGAYVCDDPICNCGRVFKYLAGRGKHLAGVRLKIQREAEAKEAPLHKAESVKKETPGEIQHMRALISKLRSIASISSELADVFEVNYNENRDLKRKLRKVEEVLGRAIDNL